MMKFFISAAVTLGAISASALPAYAQALRTFVSGIGSDVSPNCDRFAPCKSFQSAYSKTADFGEISVLDTGEYGAVQITKSITISNDGGATAMIKPSVGTSGVTISGTDNVVTLRGLDIDGGGNAGNTTAGIRAINGELHVQNCTIRYFNGTAFAGPGGSGILYEPTGQGKLFVSDTNVQYNGTSTTGGGIYIRPQGGAAITVLTRVQSEGNSTAFVIDSSAASGFVNATIADSSASGGTRHGVWAIGGGGGVDVFVTQSRIASNGGSGIRAEGSNARIFYSGSIITNNGLGLNPVSPGAVITNGTNQNRGNFSQGAPSLTIAQD